jgi:hypothetical protein
LRGIRREGWDHPRGARVIREPERRAAAERRDLQRKIRAADPRPFDRAHQGHGRTFPDRAGLQAFDFRIVPPGLALLDPAAASSERDEDEGADERQGYSTRHGAEDAKNCVKYASTVGPLCRQRAR